jgi:hypothetical protein
VPRMDHVADRDTLMKWADRKRCRRVDRVPRREKCGDLDGLKALTPHAAE